jgi:hypothetical protein
VNQKQVNTEAILEILYQYPKPRIRKGILFLLAMMNITKVHMNTAQR